MALTEQDRIDIGDLINLYGHLVDAGELDRLDELFTPDVTYDVSDFGVGELHGTAAIRAAALAVGDANPVGHHITNVVITPDTDRSVRVRSKGIGVGADGAAGSVVYDDVVTRRPDGWKIEYRKVIARRRPLGKAEPGPRDVLESWRRAAVGRSLEGMADVYAADAVHEFPFGRPGVPSRLEGREAILEWTGAVWRTNAFVYEGYRTLAVHETGDPGTIVVEQEAFGTSTASGDFVLPNLLVLTVRDGRIARVRDYVDIYAASVVAGLDT